MPPTSGNSIDADFFRVHLPRQAAAMGGSMVEVHLQGGVHYMVRRVELAETDYALLEVYPQGGIDEDARRLRTRPSRPQEMVFDRVVVPYANISYVFLSMTDPMHVFLPPA